MAKDKTVTENVPVTATERVIPVIKVVNINQPQKVMDLSTGNEEAVIYVKQEKFTAPEYDSKIHGTVEEFYRDLMAAAQALVQPVAAQIEALVFRATQDSYQAGKAAVLATGDYLTAELKAKIIQIMRGNAAFNDKSAKECFDLWKVGFMAKKTGALKILENARSLGDFTADDLL